MVEQTETVRNSQQNPYGEIEVAPEVLEVIAGIAANEVDGVYAMQGKLAAGVSELFGRVNHKKGVHLSADEEQLKVDIYCYFKYGVNVPKVAREMQKKIKDQVYHMTDIQLSEVNIHIVGIVPEKTEFQQLFEFDAEEDEE